VDLKVKVMLRPTDSRPVFLGVKVKVILRPTVSWSVCLCVKHPSRAYDQIFITVRVAGLLMWGALSNERTGLPFIIAAGPGVKSKSKLVYDWRFTANQFVLASCPLRLTTRNIFSWC
jgi:hypothetical protein